MSEVEATEWKRPDAIEVNLCQGRLVYITDLDGTDHVINSYWQVYLETRTCTPHLVKIYDRRKDLLTYFNMSSASILEMV